MDTYAYNPNEHYLIINGDSAQWITACRDHFKNIFFTIDRFHVAQAIPTIFRGHKRYRYVRKRLANFDGEGLLVELNSVVGTLEDERKEALLESLINPLSKYPETLGNYRKVIFLVSYRRMLEALYPFIEKKGISLRVLYYGIYILV